MSRIGITGGAGFIGSYVTEALLARGDEVLWLDHHKPYGVGFVGTHAPNGTEVFLGDVRDEVAVTEFAAHVDAVIHLAAVLGTQETIGNPRPAAATNVLGSLNVFEAVTQYDLPCVYAAVGNAFMREHGAGAYVITKTCAEDFTRMFNKHRGARIVAVRPMNAYGPRQSASKPFGWSPVRKIGPAFICRALSGLPIETYGDGQQVSDMIYVTDVAATMIAALDAAVADKVPTYTIECGPVTSATVNDVAMAVIDECRKYTGESVGLVRLPMRPGEVPNSVVSAKTATLYAIGVEPHDFVPLTEGIARTVEWFAANEGVTWRRPEAAA